MNGARAMDSVFFDDGRAAFGIDACTGDRWSHSGATTIETWRMKKISNSAHAHSPEFLLCSIDFEESCCDRSVRPLGRLRFNFSEMPYIMFIKGMRALSMTGILFELPALPSECLRVGCTKANKHVSH
jgi:hypothetical protein